MTDFLDEIEQQVRLAEARSRLSALPDDTLVPEELACVYLTLSAKQMKTLRTSQEGPEFFKPATSSSKAANQSVSYELGKLRSWKAKHTFKSNLDVANRTDLSGWIGEPSPFFAHTDRKGLSSIVGPANASIGPKWGDLLADAILGNQTVVLWLDPADAACRSWESASEHRKFAADFLAALEQTKLLVLSTIEEEELMEVAGG